MVEQNTSFIGKNGSFIETPVRYRVCSQSEHIAGYAPDISAAVFVTSYNNRDACTDVSPEAPAWYCQLAALCDILTNHEDCDDLLGTYAQPDDNVRIAAERVTYDCAGPRAKDYLEARKAMYEFILAFHLDPQNAPFYRKVLTALEEF